MKKTTSRTHNSTPNPILAPKGNLPGRPKHVLDLTIHFGGVFVHSPVAEYKNGASMFFSGVSGVLCGEDALKDLCRSHGMGVVRRFFRLENRGFVLMATPRDYMKMWSRALVDGKGVQLYADLAVTMVETGGASGEVPTGEDETNEATGEDETNEAVGDSETESVGEGEGEGQKSQVENEERFPRWEPNTGRFERVELVILGSDESPVQFLGENWVENEVVGDEGQGQLDNGEEENLEEDDCLFDIDVDMGTQTQPQTQPPTVSSKNKYKLKKEQRTVKCEYCTEEGHNSKGCAIKKANEAAGEMLYEVPGKDFSFHKAAVEEGTAPVDKGKDKVGETSKPVPKVASKTKIPKGKQVGKQDVVAKGPVQKEGSSKSFPSMTEQMKKQGVLPKNHSKTINVDGATIHMQTKPANVILGSSVVAMRDKKKAALKKTKKTDA